MRFFLILFFAVLAIASAQRRVRVQRPRFPIRRIPIGLPIFPGHRYRLVDDDQYAASLGGADVARYSRNQFTRRGYGRFGDYQETDVSGLSLGGAKVGLYSRERDGQLPYYG
ncbi:hypothetical protein TNIN_482191 [Trichonephila inaurata madagascariensis]|uniref:Uncharacterized protein n=1 Tax=Trichonephila inaurata madagascariensis TaxID=2747483 RepID=A0A8X7C3M9_9ARAC|nr:hypothetical protein TNIN_482191 [Trichonephila inaurata madagascariensis]